MTRLTQPLKWHGGKRYLAQQIIALMPPHLHYVEPYFGGDAVLLAKSPDGVSEVVNDIDWQLTNFWYTLQHDGLFADFKRRVEAVAFHEQAWRDAFVECDRPDGDGDRGIRAATFFVRCRQSLAGRMEDFAPLSRRRTRGGMNEQASAWLAAVDGLPAVHARLKRVVILNRDALDVIHQQDGPDTLFYLDPPYLPETRVSRDAYAHEMGPKDHAALLNALAGVQGKFLLSGYRSELYDAAAQERGWHRRDFPRPNHAAGGATKREMVECVWMNYCPGEAQHV